MMILLSARSLALKAMPMLVALLPIAVASTPLMMPGTAEAQSPRPIAKADVPFDFAVGTEKMPAGAYRIVRVNQNIVRIVAEDNKAGKSVMVFDAWASKAPEGGKLVFHHYGNRYFLSNCWMAHSNVGLQLLKSKAETEAAVLAASVSPATDVEVALNLPMQR